MKKTPSSRNPPSSGTPAGFRMATSLFGGAILATVTTNALAQAAHYFDTAALLAAATVPSGYVVLGGNLAPGDGGGGSFMPSGSTLCTPDGGIVLTDTIGHCFYRADPTYSVREWGALCDVVDVNAAGAASWNPGSNATMGTLTYPTTLASTPLVIVPGVPNAPATFIAISQIGSPTLFGTSTPAVSLTRFATLGGAATQSNYGVGDLVSFAGGTFSQQAAIIVDAQSGGTITQWHFLWGGLYEADNAPTGPLTQDSTHTYCGNTSGTANTCGVSGPSGHAYGATLIPAWSGWSVLNQQNISNPGTGYAVGQIVTLGPPGAPTATVNHYATLVVEGTTTGGGVSTFDWTDYGSFKTLTNTGTLTDISNPTIPLTFSPVAWTQAPFASTIVSAGTVGTSGMSTIVVDGTAAFPGTIQIQEFYYGHDDSVQFGRALLAHTSSAIMLPAGCGTTAALNVMVDQSSNNANPTLVGSSRESSGLYAFAYPPEVRTPTSHQILSSVIYAGILDNHNTVFDAAQGGGLRNMFIEGFGIPEGYGYWGLAEYPYNPPSSPSKYMGPPYSTTPVRTNIPLSGTAVELDRVYLMRIDNVHIKDGGIGPGNSTFQIALNDSDPTDVLGGDVGSIVVTDSRVDSNPVIIAGPSSPEIALRMRGHDSVFQNLTVLDGTKADILGPGGNIFSQIHVGSSAINTTVTAGPAPTISWPSTTVSNFGFAGVADYGLYIYGNTSLSQTRCDIANTACVFMAVDVGHSQQNPGQITDTQIGCAAFTSVPVGYTGVQMSPSTGGTKVNGTTVAGTASASMCGMPPAQLVSVLQGGPLDPTTSLCNNSNAPLAGCTGYLGGYAKHQFYTQPATNYGTVSLSGNTLYAVPFYSPSGGGPISQLGLDVFAPGAGMAQCTLGIYDAFAGRPESLLSNGGILPVTQTGPTMTNAGTVAVQLAPATLYFLAVGCNSAVTVEGVTGASGAFTVPLSGTPDFINTNTELASTWTYATSLPQTFGTPTTIVAGGSVPNVYVSP